MTRNPTGLGLIRPAILAGLAAACALAPAAPAFGSAGGGTPVPAGDLGAVAKEIVVREKGVASSRVVRVAAGQSVAERLRELRRSDDLVYAARNPIARATAFTPNDPGLSGAAGGWREAQWNFLPLIGVNAPDAWTNLSNVGRPGGRGTVVAVIDSGVAYRSRGPYKVSPDFAKSQFVRGYDFLGKDERPHDASGHGTHVASTIAERTNNGVALTGLAYGTKIMPIRVLDAQGFGDADDIARGVRYAVLRGADVINLSMEFDPRIRARDVPSLVDALRFAERRGVTVVAAAGNQGTAGVPYPAKYRSVIAVGATTIRRCAANYSNYGSRVDLVAPGGGADADLPDAGCDPAADPAANPEILQMTFFERRPGAFGFPPGYQGTSMAAPHVTATAALVIASRVIGASPSPRAILRHLQRTAQEVGPPGDDKHYGAGLLDAAAATAPR